MQSGEIFFLNEINHSSEAKNVLPVEAQSAIAMAGRGDYVRVTGHLSYIDTAKRYCEITDGAAHILIDLSIADMPSRLLPGCCCQFIGELRDIEQEFVDRIAADNSKEDFEEHSEEHSDEHFDQHSEKHSVANSEEHTHSEEHSAEHSGRLFLHARITCITDDLDLRLLKEATAVRRKFMEKMKNRKLKSKTKVSTL